MPINKDLLVSAPMLQDYLVDKDTGAPLSGGTITMYQDNSRTTLKNWYYQTGVPGNYTYITLPNPMTLTAVGTMADLNGNDIIPFYFPYDETQQLPVPQPYYVVVTDSNGEQQFTRQNFPFIPSTATPTTGNSTNQNLIVNNVFWRNIGSVNATTLSNSLSLNGSTMYYATLAPSQHDGFLMQDIQFFKNANGAVDTVSFFQFVPPASNPTFDDQVLGRNPTPEFYLNVQCTGTGMETTKYIQIPLSLHVKSLSGYTYGHMTIEAMAVPGSTNGTITVGVFQFLGSGVISPVSIPTMTINLSNSWQAYDISMPLPSAANLTLGDGGDDALYIVIGYPVGEVFNINIAKPSFYMSEDIPVDDFQTYDSAGAIFDSPRTGDIRTSANTFTPFGWVPMNDGTIGSSSSSATTRANTDTWLLYNLLWNSAQPYDSGSNSNPICQMYTSGGAATNFGSTAIGDFSANKALALTRMFGKVLLGTVPITSLLSTQSTTLSASNSAGNLLITVSNAVNYFKGMPISFTNTGGSLPGNIVANAIYYVANFNGTNTFNVATTFANGIAGTPVVAYSSAGSGTNTVFSAITGTSEGEYAHMQALAELAQHQHDPNNPLTSGSFVMSGGSAVFQGAANLGNLQGTTGNVHNLTTQFPFNVTQPGTFYNIFMKL